MKVNSPPRPATILCTFFLWLGTDYQCVAGTESTPVSPKGEITIEEAIKIAKTTIKKDHGWVDIKITSAALRQQNWRVLVWRVPAKPGGYATVVLSETGDLLRIERGQ